MMVTDFFIIYKRFIHLYRFHGQCACHLSVRPHCTGFQTLFYGGNHIVSYKSGICSWISKHLMILIQALHNIQRFLCRKSKFLIGVSLQFRCFHSLYSFFMKRAGTSTFFILPDPAVSSCPYGKTIVFLWFEIPYFFFSGCNHSQGGRLHSSTGQLSIILTGQRSGSIYAHQPVCFCAGYCSIVQRIVISSVS